MTETRAHEPELMPGSSPLSADARRPWRSALSRVNQPIIVWLLVLAAFALSGLFSSNFPSWALVSSTIVLGLFLAVIAFGQGLIILTGGLDLSVPASVALGAFFTGYFATRGFPTVLAIIVGVGIASLVGLVNGLIISRSTFPPFIVTLSTFAIATSLLLGISKSNPGQKAPRGLTALFDGSLTVIGVPVPLVLFVAFAALGLWVQSGTVFGRRTYAIGNSVRAAEVAGLKVRSTTLFVYWCAAVAYGLGGVLLLGYGSGSDLNIGAAWLLPSIAAVVVGGSSISGGSGSYLGTLGAAALLTILSINISAAGSSEGVKQVFYGCLIFLALLFTRLGGVRR